jgi:integrase
MATAKRTTPPSGLSPKFLDGLRPAAKAYEVGDRGEHKGLRASVTQHGAISFVWYVESGGRRRKITIGRYPETSLADARVELRKLKDAHRAGKLPALLAAREQAAKEPPASEPGTLTVRVAGEKFLASLDRRRPEQAEGMFTRDLFPVLGDYPVAVVTTKDVRRVIERIVKRGSPVAAKRTDALVRMFFQWCVDRADLDVNPAEKFKAKALGAKDADESKRYLSAVEIPILWNALATATTMTPTVRAGLKLLMLTGLRSQELRLATWDRVNFDDVNADGTEKPESERRPTLTVPPEHMKMKKEQEKDAEPWIVPLGPTAVALLRELHGFAKSISSNAVLASFANAGAPLSEKALVAAMAKLFDDADGRVPAVKLPGGPVTPHDFRRTLRTHARNTLRCPFDVSEKLLAHSLGKIANTYDVGDLLDERREALLAWDTFVTALLAGKSETEAKAAALSVREGATVVAMPAKAVRS